MNISDLTESEVSDFVVNAMNWTNNPSKVKAMALTKFGRKAKDEITDLLNRSTPPNVDRMQRFG